MPSILIEVGFLTNEIESNLLASERYQTMLALAIAKGIHHHIIHTPLC